MKKGQKHSTKAKEKICLAKLGKKPTLEARGKMQKAKTGKNNPMYGVHMRGKDAPFFGKKHTQETIEKIKIARAKQIFSKEIREKMRKAKIGKNNLNWKGGITPKNQLERGSQRNKHFSKNILNRDNYTCQICDNNNKLEVDHIMPWALYPRLRQDSKNARTLCKSCHIEYGADLRRKPIKWATSPNITKN